jgi:TetR/AcrR family transcriptional repressor of mexJK operon
VSEAQRNPAIGRAFWDSGPCIAVERVTGLIEQAKAKGEIATEDCRRAAETFMSLINGQLHMKRVLNIIPNADADMVRAEAEYVARTFMKAYSPRTAQ